MHYWYYFMQWTEKRGTWLKKYQNETPTRHRRDSVTVRNLKARKVNTPLLSPIHQARHWSTDASVVVFNPLDKSSILCRRICCRCCILCYHIPPWIPLSLSYISWASRLVSAASAVVSNPLDASHITRPLPTTLSSLLIPRAHLTLPTPPLSLSIPWACTHTATSAVRYVHSDALYLILPQLTPPLLSPRTWATRRHTSASVVRDVQSYLLYILLP